MTEQSTARDEPVGERVAASQDIWASHLESQVEMTREMGVESHTVIRDVEDREHEVELGSDIERIEPAENHHTRIWLRSAGIITVTGAAVAAAITLIRHRHKAKGA